MVLGCYIGTLPVYNAILGRLVLNCLQAATSMYHLIMKFPTPTGVGEAKGNQHEVSRCYVLAIKWNENLEIVHMVETIQKLL